MTLALAIAKLVAVVAVIGTVMFVLLPNADALDTSALTIPDTIWNPLAGVLGLNRYLPIQELLTIAALTLAIQVGMASMWLFSWLVKHLV